MIIVSFSASVRIDQRLGKLLPDLRDQFLGFLRQLLADRLLLLRPQLWQCFPNHPTLLLLAVFTTTSCQDASSTKPDTRAREWILPAGECVRFSHEDPGFLGKGDHAKYLDVRFSDGQSRRYSFAGSHSGYNRVELRMAASQSQIWLVDCDNGSLGAFLDLSTRRFKGEGQGPPLPPGTLFLKPN